MSEMFEVSQSKVKTWRRCRKAYNYRYVDKLKKKSKSRPLMFGTLVHEMTERHANGDDPFEWLQTKSIADAKMFSAEKLEYGEIISDVSIIMREYFAHWDEASTMTYIRKSGRSAEHKFAIEIMPDVLWNGKIDAVGKTKDRLKWLVEHKSFNRRPSDDDRWRNIQSVTYFKAIEMMGWGAVDGTCWDYIWSKSPVRPSLLKNGKLSKKKIDTLPGAVAEAIKAHGLRPLEYKDYRLSTRANRKDWFQRIHSTVDQSVSTQVFEDFKSSIKEMVEIGHKAQERNIERHCTWCDYEPLCRAAMQGLDQDYVKERQYETNSKPQDGGGQVHKVLGQY